MHNSATRLRLLSRLIVLALVIIVGIIIAIHEHAVDSHGHAATPTATPALSVPAHGARLFFAHADAAGHGFSSGLGRQSAFPHRTYSLANFAII